MRRLLYATALGWSLFQVWIASPLPYLFDLFIVSDTRARAIHLAFAVFLAFIAFPARRPGSGRWPLAGYALGLLGAGLIALGLWQVLQGDARAWVYPGIGTVLLLAAGSIFQGAPLQRVPLIDALMACIAAACAAYLFLFHQELANRPGAATDLDLLIAGCGMVLLLEATRRTLGPALLIIAGLFLFYSFAGPWMPDLIAHRGASLSRVMSQQWLSTEGVFGIALGVSTSFVFLFVLFGALLEKAGAGSYFIRVAFSLLGHMRGGPAKAAVVASCLTGVVSGSSIANTVTTGTFTIPLMKRVGFPAHKAGAIEVSSSVNGQIMPPVMGAAAFLMVEHVGISYVEVIRHAFLPALISYIALFYIVHLEALKFGMKGLPQRIGYSLRGRLLGLGMSLSGFMILAGVSYHVLEWIKLASGDASTYLIGTLILAAYLLLLWTASRAGTSREVDEIDLVLPDARSTIQSGLHFLLPVVVLVWCLVVERLSPGLSAFWAVAFMAFILITQRPLMLLFGASTAKPSTGDDSALAPESVLRAIGRGVRDLGDGMVQGARNMVAIAVATAAAGIIVGTVGMTGVGLVMADLVELLSGGNLLAMLVLTGLMCLILGMGLPTTANYIIVATLMAPVIVSLAAENGLLIPLIAAHLFVFYFGIMADVTPPVGLASFAAAAISRADPIRTGIQAFAYSLRTITLPFLFVFNTQLLLLEVNTLWQLVLTVFGALTGILVFAAATHGWFLTRSRLHESAMLLLVALMLCTPNLFMDRLYPGFETLPPADLYTEAQNTLPGGQLRIKVEGTNLAGQELSRLVMLPMGEAGTGPERLHAAGLGVMAFADRMSISFVSFGSPAERAGLEPGWDIVAVMSPATRPAPEWFFLPALGLLGLIIWMQLRRRHQQPAS